MKLVITYTLVLVALIFNATGCGKARTISSQVDCTGSTPDTTLKYSATVYDDGTADSSCAVNDKNTVAYFQTADDAERYQRGCSIGSVSYWQFKYDLKTVSANFSNGQTAVMTCVPRN